MSISCRACHPSTQWTAQQITIDGTISPAGKRKVIIHVGDAFHFELTRGQITDFINAVADTYENLERSYRRAYF